MVAWLCLIGAGILEAFWPIAIKATNGFTKPMESGIAIALIASGMFLFSIAVKTIPPAMAYIIFVGMGAVGISLVGTLFYNETFNLLKGFLILMILTGVMGLHYFFSE